MQEPRASQAHCGPRACGHFALTLLNPPAALRMAQHPVFTDAQLNLSRSHSSAVEGPHVSDTKAPLTSVGGGREGAVCHAWMTEDLTVSLH